MGYSALSNGNQKAIALTDVPTDTLRLTKGCDIQMKYLNKLFMYNVHLKIQFLFLTD
jgi:hypothetical protein